jgi:hypothetical protein
MTGDDLKHLQDHFIKGSKQILLTDGYLRSVGFVVTLRKHVDRLFESGWGLEFIGQQLPPGTDGIAVLVVDLALDWKKLYHAVLTVYPQTRNVLPGLLEIGKSVGADDPYKRLMRPFLKTTKLDVKDVMADVMRQICDKVDAFASIFHSEAWVRMLEPAETVDDVYKNAPKGFEQDAKSIEVVLSSMETYDFARMISVPILREPSKQKRDDGKILGFGDPTECIDSPKDRNVIEGRMMHFLKPLEATS